MSDLSFSGLYVIHKPFLTNCFDEELSERLAGEKIPRNDQIKGRLSSVDKHLSIGSRGNWFQSRLKLLLDASGDADLRFLSGETYTFTYDQVTRHGGEVVWKETEAYSVLNSRRDAVIAAIARLERWCALNTEVAADLLDEHSRALREAIDSAFFTLAPVNEGFDSGEGAQFVFCVLRTVGDLMRYSRFRDCWAIFRSPVQAIEEEAALP
jgi:hypothetical protein